MKSNNIIAIIKSVLIVLAVVYFGPIGLVALLLWRKSWWSNKAVKLVACSWCAMYVVGAIVALTQPKTEPTTVQAESMVTAEQKQEPADSKEESGDGSKNTDEPQDNFKEAEIKADDGSSSEKPSITPVTTPVPAQSQPQPQPQTSATPESSSPTNSHWVYGYCKDGTPAYGDPTARGKANVCYGHKGWRDEY